MGLFSFLFGTPSRRRRTQRQRHRDQPTGGIGPEWYARRDKYRRWLRDYAPGTKRHATAARALKRMGY